MYKRAIIKYSEYTVLRALLKRGKINLNLGKYNLMNAEGLTRARITTLTYHRQRPKYLILTTKGRVLLNKLFKHPKYPKNYKHLMNEAKIACLILAIDIEIVLANIVYSLDTKYLLTAVIISLIFIMIWTAKHHFLISYPIITKNQFINQIQHTNRISWNDNLIGLFTIEETNQKGEGIKDERKRSY